MLLLAEIDYSSVYLPCSFALKVMASLAYDTCNRSIFLGSLVGPFSPLEFGLIGTEDPPQMDDLASGTYLFALNEFAG